MEVTAPITDFMGVRTFEGAFDLPDDRSALTTKPELSMYRPAVKRASEALWKAVMWISKMTPLLETGIWSSFFGGGCKNRDDVATRKRLWAIIYLVN
jgi:hypothetical protein